MIVVGSPFPVVRKPKPVKYQHNHEWNDADLLGWRLLGINLASFVVNYDLFRFSIVNYELAN
jgi:hypothetical protein